jgi:hypothetical protein
LLSLRSPLVGLPVTDCQGTGSASESLSHPALLARHFQGAPRRRPHGVRPVQEDHRGCRAVGLHHDSLCRALSKPHVAEHMRQKVIKRLNLAAARAGDTKIELLDCADNMVRDRASTFVLGLASIAPVAAPSLSVNIEMKAGYVIDLTDEPRPPRILP